MTEMHRREFMAGAVACSAAAGMVVAGETDSAIARDPFPVEWFEERVGSSFSMIEDGGTVAQLRIKSVERLESNAPARFRRPFSVLLEVPEGFVPQQDVVKLAHRERAVFSHLVVPVRDAKRHPALEMVFS